MIYYRGVALFTLHALPKNSYLKREKTNFSSGMKTQEEGKKKTNFICIQLSTKRSETRTIFQQAGKNYDDSISMLSHMNIKLLAPFRLRLDSNLWDKK